MPKLKFTEVIKISEGKIGGRNEEVNREATVTSF